MGWLQTLMGNTGDGIAKPIDAVGNALDKVFTSDDERLSHAEVMEKLQQNLPTLTAELDKLNAVSSVPLVQLARPLCVYIAALNFFQLSIAVIWLDRASTIPQWFIDASVTSFLGALGIYGALRSVEKLTNKIK